MTLVREWIPSPNYSGGGKKRLIVIHTTEGFTGANGMYDLAHYFGGNVGASSQVGIDNFHPGRIVEMVSRSYGSWTQCNFNSVSVSVEQCAYASWSRDTWLNDKMPLLENTAAWIGEESRALGIPITRLTASQAQGGSAGVCGHSDLGSSGCGHSDPGSGYPWDVMLEMARGNMPSQPPVIEEPEDTDEMPYFHVPAKDQSTETIEISLDGMFSNVGVLTDASTHEESTCVRIAFHLGQKQWHVAEVWSDKGHEKVVYTPPGKFDGITISRKDKNTTTLVVNAGR